MLDGRASWDDVDGALVGERGFLATFVADQNVQTNEVRRAWGLLPGLLALAAPRVDLLELGASGGLLTSLDRYAYRYRSGSWGDGELLLDGDDRGGPPASLLERPLEVVRRRGVDLAPIDVATEHGARLLEAFVWPDQMERVERLREAIAIVRRDPPAIVAGDYVELLPSLLQERRDDVLTVVLSSVTTAYLDDDGYAQLVRALDAAGGDGPLAWVSLEGLRGEPEYGGVALELTTWPGGETKRLAKVDFHATWLEWAA